MPYFFHQYQLNILFFPPEMFLFALETSFYLLKVEDRTEKNGYL